MNRIAQFASGVVLLAAASAQAATFDDFNRDNAATLGANWTQQVGMSSIIDGKATGSELALATYNGGTGNTVSFDIANVGSDTQYIAAVLGYGAGNNLFIKVQNNGGNQGFNKYAFYTNNNGSGYFGDLSGSFLSGHVQASFAGNIATLLVTPDGGNTQTYTYNYGFTPAGTGVGLGFYGKAQADNFTAAVPEPETYAMLMAGLGLVGWIGRRRKMAK